MYRSALNHALNKTATGPRSGSTQTLNSTMSGSRQTLNSTMSGSRQTLNSTTSEKNPASGHLKLVLIFINDHIEDVGLERKLKLDDFNRLTSEQMLKIVTFLLWGVIGEKQIHQDAWLREFQDFGVGTSSYDCGIDQIYHAVKPIFPPENDLFHYSVLLMPAVDPKRTKGVISYLMSFALMCDNLKERFAENHKQILDEIDEEQLLYGEVEDLTNAIHDKIQQRAVEINQIPMLKEELKRISDSIGHSQVELAKWNGEIEKLTGAFQKEQSKIQRLNEKLQKIQMELIDLKQSVVNDPNPLLLKNETMKKQFQTEWEKREALAKEIEQLGNEREAYDVLNQRAKITVQSLEAEVSRLVDIRERIELQTKTVNDTSATKSKIARGKANLNKLLSEFEKKQAGLGRTVGEHEKEFRELAEEHNNTKQLIQFTKRQTKFLNQACSDAVVSIDVVADLIEETKDLITKYIYEVTVRIPQLKNQHLADAEEMKDRIAANFCNYPEL